MQLNSYIDHTLLKSDATQEQIKNLCAEARAHGFATVCVNGSHVKFCAEQLKGTRVKVCSVVGFPLGAGCTEAKLYETERCLADGAREIDMVMNIGALKSGDLKLVGSDIAALSDACHAGSAILKVIIETALLTKEEKVLACQLAEKAKADYVKTCTGFCGGGATPEDVALMRASVTAAVKVKASGGIKDYASAKALINAGAARIGASASVSIVKGA